VLFSNPQIAAYINENFEPTWQSVRPVPTVQIDFGNGNVIKRTLHGNIATYACSSDGKVLDVLPGLYKPNTYLDALKQFRLLAQFTTRNGKVDQSRLLQYHSLTATALSKDNEPGRFQDGKEIAFVCLPRKFNREAVDGDVDPKDCTIKSAEAVANWATLTRETLYNETHKRLQIHRKLLQAGSVQPQQITSWLYRDVLHADIDDPLLGLGPTLTATYPFRSGQ
jgi:hypothetical protein